MPTLRFRPSSARLLIALCCCGFAVGCERPAADNLLIVSFDTTRADRLAAYGHAEPTSPTVDALADAGVLFENAFAHVPSTLPSHCSLLTGLLPPSHGVRSNGQFRLADHQLSLAEILVDEGFATGAVIAGLPLDARFGMDQGFVDYDGDFRELQPHAPTGDPDVSRWFGHRYERFERTADEITDRAIDWIERRRGRWFLLAHYFDPHTPYAPPAPWDARFDDPYDGEIAFADDQLGRLLEAVREAPGRTLIVFTADHGEGLGDHGEEEHGRFLYNATLRVPLVMALENRVPAGRRIAGNVALIDVLPTVLDLLGVRFPASLPGQSLAPVLQGSAEPLDRPIYGESLVAVYEAGRKLAVHSIVDGSYKLVRTVALREGRVEPRFELYDMRADPRELQELADRDADVRRRLGEDLGAWIDRLEAKAAPSERFELDEDMREALRSLGYLK